MTRIAVIIHECHPSLGSEAHSGWNYLNGLSGYAVRKGITIDVFIAETNIMHTVSYKKALKNVNMLNINMRFLAHSKFFSETLRKRQAKNGGVGSFSLYYFKYYLWLRKLSKLLSGYTTVHYYNHLIGFFLTKKICSPEQRLIVGPLSGVSIIPADYASLKEIVRLKVQTLLLYRFKHLFSGEIHSLYYVGVEDEVFAQEVSKYSMRIPEQALTRRQLNKVNSIHSGTNTNLKLVWIGELVPRKNIEVLLEALRKSPNLELTVIGDGPLKPILKDKYEDLLSNGVVNFTGKIAREEVFSYLNNSDILVHTSYREGTATTIVEAISNGNFVVAIDIGGHSCLINETTGILLPLVERSQLIEELVTTLKRLEVNRELLKKQKLTWTWEDTLENITRNYV